MSTKLVEAEARFVARVSSLCEPTEFAAAVEEFRRIIGWAVDQGEILDFVDALYQILGIDRPTGDREVY